MTIEQKMIKSMDFSILEMVIKGIRGLYNNLNPSIFSYGKIKETFNASGLSDILTSEMDTNYAFLSIESAEELVWDVMTLINKLAYKLDFTDCDNFAFLTSSLMSFLYGINTCGVCWGEAYNNETGKLIAAHYFNVLITYNSTYNKFELWVLDSLNPGIEKIEVGQQIIINNWRYENLKNVKYF